MAQYTNTTNGPKAVNTEDRGVVILAPGASEDLKVSAANAKALKDTGLLDGDATSGVPSLAELQKEIASGATPTAADTDDSTTDDGLPAADDPDVVKMVADNNSQELQQLASDLKVDMTGAKNKTDAAQRIIAAQRATEATDTGEGGNELPDADDADVVALMDANDEAGLRQIAEDEQVDVKTDDDKDDLARKIVAARRAA